MSLPPTPPTITDYAKLRDEMDKLNEMLKKKENETKADTKTVTAEKNLTQQLLQLQDQMQVVLVSGIEIQKKNI